jgi:hypothetical protein
MDETGFLWERLPSSGLTTTSSGKKLDKTRITANLCCNEDGSFFGLLVQLKGLIVLPGIISKTLRIRASLTRLSA